MPLRLKTVYLEIEKWSSVLKNGVDRNWQDGDKYVSMQRVEWISALIWTPKLSNGENQYALAA